MAKITEINHPLVKHKLSLMRDKNCSTVLFRSLMKEISFLLGYEVSRHWSLKEKEIETPLEKTKASMLDEEKITLISIMRAGYGLLGGMLELFPHAKVGHIGLYRDAKAKTVVEYYLKLPPKIAQQQVIVLDPMLATGQSAVIAIKRLKEFSCQKIQFISLLASPEGIDYFHKFHPDVSLFTASIDRELNNKGYILPGLGDAGDRLFATQ